MDRQLAYVLFSCFALALSGGAGLGIWLYNRGRAQGRVEGIGVGLRQAGLLPGTSYTVHTPDGDRVIHLLGPGERPPAERVAVRLLRAGH